MRPALRDLAIVLAASWLARAIFSALIGDAHSLDVDFWQGVASAREEGKNPYETGVLNWPPLWLEVIVAIDGLRTIFDVAFLTVLRLYLIAIESLIVVVLYLTLVSVGARRDATRRALLVGIALNPVMIILVVQHGNSDVNVGLFVSLGIAALVAHARSRDVMVWLVGCLFLGLGVLAKTAPLVLAPLLAPGFRRASRTGRALGLLLFLGPAALGLSVIAALVPRATWEHVINYRSTRGFFGYAGLLEEVSPVNNRYLAGTIVVFVAVGVAALLLRRSSRVPPLARVWPYGVAAAVLVGVVGVGEVIERYSSFEARSRYGTLFTLGVVALVVWLGYRLLREPLVEPARLYLIVAVVFMAVVAFGPGYGAHYAPWFFPALVATYVLLDDEWRRLLRIAWVVAALTYAVEYAFIPFLGWYANAIFGPAGWIEDTANWLNDPLRLVLVRVPLFAVYLVLIAEGVARLVELGRAARLQQSVASSATSG